MTFRPVTSFAIAAMVIIGAALVVVWGNPFEGDNGSAAQEDSSQSPNANEEKNDVAKPSDRIDERSPERITDVDRPTKSQLAEAEKASPEPAGPKSGSSLGLGPSHGIPVPKPRPRVRQVFLHGDTLGYGDAQKLVWCVEEDIDDRGFCTRALDDMLAGKAKGVLSPEEFIIGPLGMTHIPTGTRFVAPLPGFRFGIIVDGEFSRDYPREAVVESMKNLWRQNIDSLDPNSGIASP